MDRSSPACLPPPPPSKFLAVRLQPARPARVQTLMALRTALEPKRFGASILAKPSRSILVTETHEGPENCGVAVVGRRAQEN